MKYIIYTDGGCSSDKIGGIAFVILNEKEKIIATFNKRFKDTTNQRMEQMAVAIALESIRESSDITIISDSAYVVNTYNENWKRKCNNDLWDRIDKAKAKHNVTFKHIKGHNGDKYNEMCDVLATNIIKNC